MAKVTYPDGVDCVWVARDRDGHVGAFVTGGQGPVPVQVLASDAVDLQDVEERIGRLPPVSTVRVLVQIKRPDDFVAMAERGLFVYDWTDVQRPRSESIHAYEPVAVPEQPITIEMVPEQIIQPSVCPVLNVTFADGKPLDVSNHVDCREAE